VHLLKVNNTKNSTAEKLQVKLYLYYHYLTQFHSLVYRQSQHKIIIHQNSEILFFFANKMSLDSGLSLANRQ